MHPATAKRELGVDGTPESPMVRKSIKQSLYHSIVCLISVRVVIIINQQRAITPGCKVLLKATIRAGVGIS